MKIIRAVFWAFDGSHEHWDSVTSIYAWAGLLVLLPFNAIAWRFALSANRVTLEVTGEPMRSVLGVRGDYALVVVMILCTLISTWYVVKCFVVAHRHRHAEIEPPRQPRPPRPKPNRPKRRRQRR